MSQPLQIGDKVYLGRFLANVNAFGVISDLDTPDQVQFTIEGYGSNATLSTSALVGPAGPAGTSAPLGNRQFPVLDSVDDLPNNLTDDQVDLGKYWVIRVFDADANEIGSNWAMWNGSAYELYKEGEPGQAGPVPNITPTFELVTPDVTTTTQTIVTGDSFNPSWHTKINKELIRGPVGAAAPWGLYTTGGEVDGDLPIWDSHTSKYIAGVPRFHKTNFYTFPEGHFVSNPLQIGTRVPIGTALIPPIAWQTVPYVQGHFRLTGIEADTTPFIIGVEVRLGNPTSGQVVARGYGNITGYVNLIPHASTVSTPNDAITPDNGRAVILANSTGAPSTLYINAFNDGATGLYNFDATGAQLSALMIPVTLDGS